MLEEKIKNTTNPSIRAMGYGLVKVSLKGGERKVLEVLIDRLDGKPVGVEDCRQVSKNISAILDVEDVIEDKYFLEVSSAGVERPLVTLEDYERFKGRDAKIILHDLQDGKSKYRGTIESVNGEEIALQTNDGEDRVFGFNEIKKANLLFTDEMAKELFKKSNKTKKSNIQRKN